MVQQWRRRPAPSIPLLTTVFMVSCLGSVAFADWKDEVGYTRLQLLVGDQLPGVPAEGFEQVEAPDTASSFEPNTSDTLFTGKTFNHQAGTSGISNHAQQVATNLYGNPSSLVKGSCQINLDSAGHWLTNFIRRGTNQSPPVETRAIVNLSWIATTDDQQATESNMRLDYAIDRDGFVCVVGANNGNSTTLPQLWEQSYHTISVGLVNGSHSAGFTALDVSGRIKPDIVAPDGATSFATPMVGSAAGLLYSKLASAPYALVGADRSRVVKALLLATARKDTISSWGNTTTRPLDLRYGAGEMNVLHAYNTLSAGPSSPSNSTTSKAQGWSVNTASSSNTRSYYFTIPTGSPKTPFCASLVWHRTVTKAMFNSWTANLSNLNLRLFTANGFTPGSLITESNSAVDNVELIYQPELPPGNYLLQVGSSTAASTTYALAWHSLPAASIIASQGEAREIDGQPGEITIQRTGDITLPLFVPLTISGSAVAGSDYQAIPASVTIPANEASIRIPVVPISDEFAQGDRSLTVGIASDFALVRDASQTATVVIHDKPFDAWRFFHFTPLARLDPQISSPAADPDADGLVNLIEYALDLDPNGVTSTSGITSELGNTLIIHATKNPSATDVTWNAEVSSDLESWEPAEITNNNPNDFSAQDVVPIEADRRRFIRLKITKP